MEKYIYILEDFACLFKIKAVFKSQLYSFCHKIILQFNRKNKLSDKKRDTEKGCRDPLMIQILSMLLENKLDEIVLNLKITTLTKYIF